MFGGIWSQAWKKAQEEADEALGEKVPASSVSAERAKAIIVLNTWKRERSNQGDVLDLVIQELKLREKWEVPE